MTNSNPYNPDGIAHEATGGDICYASSGYTSNLEYGTDFHPLNQTEPTIIKEQHLEHADGKPYRWLIRGDIKEKPEA